jgi:hypothetical protein
MAARNGLGVSYFMMTNVLKYVNAWVLVPWNAVKAAKQIKEASSSSASPPRPPSGFNDAHEEWKATMVKPYTETQRDRGWHLMRPFLITSTAADSILFILSKNSRLSQLTRTNVPPAVQNRYNLDSDTKSLLDVFCFKYTLASSEPSSRPSGSHQVHVEENDVEVS